MDAIQLKKSDSILKFEIIDENNASTGEYLEFDLEDVELPLRLSEAQEKHNENLRNLKSQMIIIDKEPDEEKTGMLTKNQIKKYKAIQEFYKKETEALDLFLGEGGTAKLLNGRKPFYTMYDYINELLKPILPKLNAATDNVVKSIKDKYKVEELEKGVLTIDDQ